jgi:GT2 family glycosyltransferase
LDPAPPAPPTRVAVVVLTFDSARWLEGCLGSLRAARAASPGIDLDLIVVDNASRDGTPARIRAGWPEATLLESGGNLGFAGGNNLGMRLALERGAEFVYLLNPDTEVDPAFLSEALAVAWAEPGAGAVQSLLLLGREPGRINTAGNQIHFLGFGYCGSYRRPLPEAPPAPREIAFASGAGVLYRAEALRQVGLLDEALFLYQEDQDLGWRLRLAGYPNLVAPRSVVIHHYEFTRRQQKYYYLERNRYWVLGKNLRLRNLLLLFPFLLAAELGLLALAAASGWLPQKLRADRDAFRPSALRRVRADRRRIAALRKVSDREIFRLFTPVVDFEGAASAWFTGAANTVLRLVWAGLRPLIR